MTLMWDIATNLDNQSVIGFNNASDASLDVRAVCAYL